MKTTIIVLAIVLCASLAQAQSSTYDPFQPRQNSSNLGQPRSFEQPQQPTIRQYQTPPDMNFQIRPGYGDKPRAYDLNTGEQLNVQRRSLGGCDITRYRKPGADAPEAPHSTISIEVITVCVSRSVGSNSICAFWQGVVWSLLSQSARTL
jgi:hypothetical protein